MHKAIFHTGVAAGVLTCGLGLAQAADDKPAAEAVPVAAEAGPVSSGVVIVTGTRASGLKAENSASPIQVLDSASLARTGQPDLIQALAQNLPSLTAQAFGGDMANMTLSARLRGLSPNNTLVLVNGKRRHGTANLAVLGGPYQGGAAADLNYIPVAAIDHIEVLQDGAAAQYGTDAIAGVINIILKKNYRGGSANINGGGYGDGGGHTGDGSANLGLEPFANAYLNLSAETKYHGFSDRGGIDPRVNDAATLASMPQLRNAPGYPYLNHISGDAQYRQHIAAANFGAELSDSLELYGFATYGKKKAAAFENYRMPNRLPSIYPLGFSPQETFREEDYAFTAGLKGKLAGGWNWDLSSTYGKDVARLGVAHSGNVSLLADTGATPLDFYAGEFVASQWTNNLDLSHDFDAGWATPLTFAIGAEQRRDTYAIGAGDAASRYKEGSQSFPGFSLTDAGSHSRTNKAVYANIAGRSTWPGVTSISPTSATPRSASSPAATISRPRPRCAPPIRTASAPRPWRRNTTRPPMCRRAAPSCSWRRIRRARAWSASTACGPKPRPTSVPASCSTWPPTSRSRWTLTRSRSATASSAPVRCTVRAARSTRQR
jgi:iron complex outermembrane receptor protein